MTCVPYNTQESSLYIKVFILYSISDRVVKIFCFYLCFLFKSPWWLRFMFMMVYYYHQMTNIFLIFNIFKSNTSVLKDTILPQNFLFILYATTSPLGNRIQYLEELSGLMSSCSYVYNNFSNIMSFLYSVLSTFIELKLLTFNISRICFFNLRF